jgi:MFS family permease
MLSRPLSGKMADKMGRIPVMIIGSVVCFLCSLFYPILTTVAGFMLLRLLHGFSTGFTPTGQTAYLSDIIPVEKRGEAMGLLGTASSVGMASGPPIGGLLINHFNADVMFYTSSGFAILSIIILFKIKETVKNRKRFTITVFKFHKHDLFEPRVLMPCLVMGLAAYSFGAILTIIPDFGSHLGVKNKGLLFTYFTLASLVVRLMGGKASDRWGRQPVLIVSTSLLALSMLIIGFAEHKLQLFTGVVMYGLAHGITSPTLFAWAADLSDVNHKGRGMGSLYIFMEFGIGMGAFISGYLYGNDPSQFMITFLVCGLLAALACIYLVSIKRKSIAT